MCNRFGFIVCVALLLILASCSVQRIGGGGRNGVDERYIHVDKPPRLVLIRDAAVYYAPESRYDIFFFGGWWYYYLDQLWYTSASYKGPWKKVEEDSLPLAIMKIPSHDFKTPPPGWGKGGEEKPPGN